MEGDPEKKASIITNILWAFRTKPLVMPNRNCMTPHLRPKMPKFPKKEENILLDTDEYQIILVKKKPFTKTSKKSKQT